MDVPVIGKVDTPRQFMQLGILVVDGSGSMTEPTAGNITKAQATNLAVRELFTRIKASRVKHNFMFAVITFDDHPTVRLQPTEALQVDDNADYDPTIGHGDGTRIDLALEEAERIATGFLANAPAEGVPHSVVILVMSDGLCHQPDRTRQIANRIKTGPFSNKITICSTLFATIGNPDPAGEQLLRDIATDPSRHYKTVYDAETLRGFFIASLSTASGVRIA